MTQDASTDDPRSPAHAEASRLRASGCTYGQIGAALGCTAENARQMVKLARVPKKKPGRKPGLQTENRHLLNVRLPPDVIEALQRAVDENATSTTEEVEARLVETLIKDGLLPLPDAAATRSTFVAVSARLADRATPYR